MGHKTSQCIIMVILIMVTVAERQVISKINMATNEKYAYIKAVLVRAILIRYKELLRKQLEDEDDWLLRQGR